MSSTLAMTHLNANHSYHTQEIAMNWPIALTIYSVLLMISLLTSRGGEGFDARAMFLIAFYGSVSFAIGAWAA